MHAEKFADSYDYAKRVLLQEIPPPGVEWLVHPMLFKSIGGGPPGGGLDVGQYADFLGLPHEAVLPGNQRKRRQMVQDVDVHLDRYLFLDPDTGIHFAGGTTRHVTAHQLCQICQGRPGNIVLVFDNAYLYGDGPMTIMQRLNDLAANPLNLAASAVIVRESPLVCFVWLSTDWDAVEAVTARLRANLNLPGARIVLPG